ncbi:MAG: hydrogenase maturation protease [Planctomycetota bacterium]
MSDPLLSELRAACPLPVAAVGVGNALKGDDGFGPAVLAALPELEGVVCFDAGMAPENWLGPIARAQPASILVLDAADLDEPPGTLRLLQPDALDDTVGFTHGLPLGFFFELLADRCDAPLRVLLAQPAAITFGEALSEPMVAAVERAAALLRAMADPTARRGAGR